MSISASLSSALSGLTAASKMAEVVSSNIANATTPGYGRREVLTEALTVGSDGQGVRVAGVYRHSDPILIGDRRAAQAGTGDRDVRTAFLRRLETSIGGPDDATSLGARIAAFDTALIEATSRPESEARLSQVAESARGLVQHIAKTSQDIQAARAAADDRIEAEVQQVNSALTRLAELNAKARAVYGTERDASAFMDQRQQLIDSIASIIPLREAARDSGQIALYTTGGAVLLEGTPSVLTFGPVGVITPAMTHSGGALSGLSLNGRPLATAGDGSPIAGGSLAAHFAVRDDLAPSAQSRLDAVARDLVERFSAPGLDSSLPSGAAGLFTDAGAAFLGGNEIGLSERLTLNAAVDPRQGGALWRLRDGLGATIPGAVGDARFLNRLQAALADHRNPASGGFMAGARSFATLAADFLSGAASARLTSEGEASYATARVNALKIMEAEGGVDTDQEMQSLLLVEQAYSANAKVVQTIHDMIQTLLSM